MRSITIKFSCLLLVRIVSFGDLSISYGEILGHDGGFTPSSVSSGPMEVYCGSRGTLSIYSLGSLALPTLPAKSHVLFCSLLVLMPMFHNGLYVVARSQSENAPETVNINHPNT